MAEPVIAAELAETLRALLVASKRDRDASDNALCLLPEQDTEWPEGYDFEALEAAHEEEIAARQSLRERHTATESLLARYNAQQAAKAALSSSDTCKPALSEVEKAAVSVIAAYIYGESYEECDNAVFALQEALKRIGAL